MIVEGKNMVLGRLASHVASKLLAGERIDIVNAENVVITGRKEQIISRFKSRASLRAKGNPEKGPKTVRNSDLIVRKAVQNMLPSRRTRGRQALKRLKVFVGLPEEFKRQKIEVIKEAENRLKERFIHLSVIAQALGGKR